MAAKKPRGGFSPLQYFLMSSAALVTLVFCACAGSVYVPPLEALSAILGRASEGVGASIIVNVRLPRVIAVMLSGGLCGIGGICFAYSISTCFSSSIYMGYGYLAIAALIFGNWKILPTFGACLLFGFARSGGYKLVQILGLQSMFSDLIMTLPYVVTLLLLVFFSGNNRAPRALGEIYDKGKR